MNNPPLPDTLILDAGGVLFYIRETRNQVFHRILCAKGMHPAQADAAINTLSDFDARYFAEHGDIVDWQDESRWLTQRCQHLALASALPQSDLAEQLRHLSLDTLQYELFEDTLDALEMLSTRFALHVLSNATATLDWAFDQLDIRRYFGEVIISSYEKCAKPDPEIYRRCLRRLNRRADQCFFVDDQIQNVEAASNLGMHSLRLDRNAGDSLISLSKRLLHHDR